MKTHFNKIKAVFISLYVTIISLLSKVMGQLQIDPSMGGETSEGIYGVPPLSTSRGIITTIIEPLLVGLTFIIGIVNFVKIRKIDNKSLKKKRIKRTIIILGALILLFIACLVLV